MRTSSVDKHSREDEQPVQLCNYVDVYKNDVVAPHADLMRATAAAEEIARFRLQIGDSVLTKDSEDPSDIGISAHVVATAADFVCGYHLAIARPGVGTHPRYLTWAIRSRPVLDHFSTHASGISRYGLPTTGLRAAPIPWHPEGTQRRIADFLDDRVARIDQIIAARHEQGMHAVEMATASAAALMGSVEVGGPPLSAVCAIVDTEHKTAPSVPGGGTWIAGTGAIKDGRLVRDRLRETDPESFAEWTVRGVPEIGDILLTREAPVGEVALLTDQDPPIAIGQRVVLLKPDRGLLDPRFLRLALMAGEIRRVIALACAGSLHPHLNMSDISRLRIPDLTSALQRSLGREHELLLEAAEIRARELERSITLLAEYKQSLITAAVTGELDVTTAGSGIPNPP